MDFKVCLIEKSNTKSVLTLKKKGVEMQKSIVALVLIGMFGWVIYNAIQIDKKIIREKDEQKIEEQKSIERIIEKSFCDLDGKQNKKVEVWWFQSVDKSQNLEKRYRCVPK